MKKVSLLSILFLFLIFCPRTFAQQASPIKQIYEKAKVVSIGQQGVREIEGVKNPYQDIRVTVLDGEDKGKTIEVKSGYTSTLTPAQVVHVGEDIILTKITNAQGREMYQVYDAYRITPLIYLALLFVVLVIFLAGWKGIGSLLGLCISLIIITLYIVPQILSGHDPLMTSIYGSLVILLITTYLAHGVSRQTTVALLSTFISLLLTAWISSVFVGVTHLTGFTEETSSLQFGLTRTINVQGLLLGGIIIGTLGALNDVTTTQAASVFELAATDTKLRFASLYKKGFSIGREHVVSLVNTLVLAYAGSSLALFLFLLLNPAHVPLWVMVNSEEISDEIVRTLAGSVGLILVVPIVTLIAAMVCDKHIRENVSDILLALK